jgi:very-short-patch-repair endonuclease
VAAFSGRTAAWVHGIDVEPCNPIEVTIPKDIGVSARSGLALRRAALAECEVVVVHGWRIASIEHTLGDLCSRASLTESVVFLDMALHARLVDVTLLKTYADGRARRAGVVNFRRAVSFAEAATESPMESRLRMLLVLSGLPRPQVQVSLIDRQGRFVGRADLYYPAARLVIEYDGGNHRDRLVEDNRRQNLMVNAGFRLLRFTAADIRNRPDVVAAQVRSQLAPY